MFPLCVTQIRKASEEGYFLIFQFFIKKYSETKIYKIQKFPEYHMTIDYSDQRFYNFLTFSLKKV